MALGELLKRAIVTVTEEGAEEIAMLVRTAGLPDEAADHVQQTLHAFPGLLIGMERSPADEGVPPYAQALFAQVMAYLLEDDNLIPSHAGKPILGLLDDDYLLHRAALEIGDALGRVDLRSVAGGCDLLSKLLPRDVVTQLEHHVTAAKEHAASRGAT